MYKKLYCLVFFYYTTMAVCLKWKNRIGLDTNFIKKSTLSHLVVFGG